MDFKVDDLVEIYGRIIGWVSYINYQKEEADIIWDEGNFEYMSAVVPFKYIKKVEVCYGNR